MNTITSFRLCKLSDEELLKKVDEGTDKIFKTGDIPSRHIPARPDSAYDLLVGELILRFKERLCPPPVGAEVVSQAKYYVEVSVQDELPMQGQHVTWKMDNNHTYYGYMDEDCGNWWVYLYNDKDEVESFSASDFTHWLKHVAASPSAPVVAEDVLKTHFKNLYIFEHFVTADHLEELRDAIVSAMKSYAASLHSPAERKGDAVVKTKYFFVKYRNWAGDVKAQAIEVNNEDSVREWLKKSGLEEIELYQIFKNQQP